MRCPALFFATRSQAVLCIAALLLLWPDASQPAWSASPVEQLRKGLADPDPSRRFEAIRDVANAQRDLEPVEIVSQLLTALDDEFPDIRAAAAEAIGAFGGQAEMAIPKLITRLSDGDITIALKGVWTYCSEALGKIGPAAIEPLLAEIPDSDRLTYVGVMGALAEMKDDAKTTVPRLIELLRSCPEDRRWSTIYALQGIGKASHPAVADLVKQLDHDDFNIQCIACRALTAIGPPAKPAAAKLLHIIEHGLPSSRGQAATTLGAIGIVEGVDTIGILTGLLQDKNQVIRERAMVGLGHLGPTGREAAGAVATAMNDPGFWPKPEAAKTLWLITDDSSKAVPRLIQLMSSATYDLRVMEMLAEMGPDATAAAPHLAAQLKSDDQEVRLLAARALGAMGPAAKEHLAALSARLEDSNRDVVKAIETAIRQLGQEPNESSR